VAVTAAHCGVMRVVVASLPAYGHLYPLMPLAQAFALPGHEVVVAVGDPFLGRLPFPTVRAPCRPTGIWAGSSPRPAIAIRTPTDVTCDGDDR
jgi:hypothetical protein